MSSSVPHSIESEHPAAAFSSLGLEELIQLPPVVLEQIAADWILREDPLSHQRARDLLPHCDLVDSHLLQHLSGYGHRRQGLNAYLMTAFARSSSPDALRFFLDCVRQQMPASIEKYTQLAKEPGQYGLQEFLCLDEPSGYLQGALKTSFGLPFLEAILLGRHRNVECLLESPFLLHDPASNGNVRHFLPDPQRQGIQSFALDGRINPLSEVLARAEPWRDIALRMIERHEFQVLLRHFFFAAPPPTGSQAIVALTDRANELTKFRSLAPAFAGAWPVFRVFLEQESEKGRDLNTLTPEWAASLLFSTVEDARNWAHTHLSQTAKHKALESCTKNDSLFKLQIACTDERGWDLVMEQPEQMEGFLAANRDSLSFLMQAVHLQSPEQFEHVLRRIHAIKPVALASALEHPFWVVQQSGHKGMRKKGTFLAYCVVQNRPEHARAARKIFPSSDHSVRYAKDAVVYCRVRDPATYGVRAVASWESLLLGDLLAEQKARKAEALALSQVSTAQESMPSNTASAPASPESPPSAPRRRNRL